MVNWGFENMKKRFIFYLAISFFIIILIENVYGYNPVLGCASIEANFDGQKTITINFDWSGCDVWEAGLYAYDLHGNEIYKKAPLTGGDGHTIGQKNITLTDNYYGIVTIKIKGNTGTGFKHIIAEKEIEVRDEPRSEFSNPQIASEKYFVDVINKNEVCSV